MKPNLKTLLFFVTIIVFVALALTFVSENDKEENASQTIATNNDGDVAGANSSGNDYITRLAKALQEKGMVLYGSDTSESSFEQRELFGDSVKYLDYVECDSAVESANADECIAQGVETYPTWIYEGKKYNSVLSLAELAQIIGFSS